MSRSTSSSMCTSASATAPPSDLQATVRQVHRPGRLTGADVGAHPRARRARSTLFGFSSSHERRTFELLLNTHGVGPSLALAILPVHSPEALARCVAAGDIDALALVPGIGKKTAQRLVLELAQRLELIASADLIVHVASAAEAEVREALGALGYAHDEIRVALEHLSETDSVEELLPRALAEACPETVSPRRRGDREDRRRARHVGDRGRGRYAPFDERRSPGRGSGRSRTAAPSTWRTSSASRR